MNAHDWFEDNNITDKLEKIVNELKEERGTHSEDSRLDIFVSGLKGIIRTAHQFYDVTPLLVSTILDPYKEMSLNGLIEKSFYAVTRNVAFDNYELQKIEYVEEGHKVIVDFKHIEE